MALQSAFDRRPHILHIMVKRPTSTNLKTKADKVSSRFVLMKTRNLQLETKSSTTDDTRQKCAIATAAINVV